MRLKLSALAIVCIACGLAVQPAQSANRPNVLVIVADDLRPDCLGALGHPTVKTPHLDRLVERGFVFRNAHCQGSNHGAVCTPSRNMLLSGQSYFRNWPGGLAPGDGPNLPTAMRAGGYFTYRDGKRGNVARAINERYDRNLALGDDERERNTGQPGRTITDRAITFLEQRSDTRPFCLVLEFETPHDPRVAAPEYLALYRREEIPLPANYLPVHPFDNGEMLVRDERLAPWPRTPAEIRRQLHEYYAVISGFDAHVGRLLQTLETLHLRDDTLIVFLSDHGLAMGSHGLMGKQNLYEHSMGAPLVFAGPGIRAGKSDALVYLLDVFPTICDLVDLPAPADIDGRSLAGIIRGQATGVRDSLFTAYGQVQRAVRDERWKLIRYPQVDQTQLFDLKSDPDERQNLAAAPEQAKRVAQLTELLRKWQRDLKDTAPLTVVPARDPRFVPPRD